MVFVGYGGIWRLQVYDIEKLDAGVPRAAWNAHAAHVTALCCVRPPAVALLSAATNGTIGYWDLRKKPSKPTMAWSQARTRPFFSPPPPPVRVGWAVEVAAHVHHGHLSAAGIPPAAVSVLCLFVSTWFPPDGPLSIAELKRRVGLRSRPPTASRRRVCRR